jgi:hypothetical protein
MVGNSVLGFAPVKTSTSQHLTCLAALSERQMQFWEETEEGLDDIEDFYAKKDQDIDRIREFGRR